MSLGLKDKGSSGAQYVNRVLNIQAVFVLAGSTRPKLQSEIKRLAAVAVSFLS